MKKFTIIFALIFPPFSVFAQELPTPSVIPSTPLPTVQQTPVPTATAEVTATPTATVLVTITPVVTATPTVTPKPSGSPIVSATPINSAVPSVTPQTSPTPTPVDPSLQPSISATAQPTQQPEQAVGGVSEQTPTLSPSPSPSATPQPTRRPVAAVTSTRKLIDAAYYSTIEAPFSALTGRTITQGYYQNSGMLDPVKTTQYIGFGITLLTIGVLIRLDSLYQPFIKATLFKLRKQRP